LLDALPAHLIYAMNFLAISQECMVPETDPDIPGQLHLYE